MRSGVMSDKNASEISSKFLENIDNKMDNYGMEDEIIDKELECLASRQSDDPFSAASSELYTFSSIFNNAMESNTTQQLGGNGAVTLNDSELMPPPVNDIMPHTNIDLMPPPENSLLVNVQFQEDVTSPSSFSSVSSPEILSPSNSGIASPNSFLYDTNSQLSLIQTASELHLDSDNQTQKELSANCDKTNSNWIIMDELKQKVPRSEESFDVSSPTSASSSVNSPPNTPFDPSEAISSSQFIFTTFGSGVPGVFTFSAPVLKEMSTKTCDSLTTRPVTAPLSTPPVQNKKSKPVNLNSSFPAKLGPYELKILNQPEEQHRARYATEGSRGAVKDKAGHGHPAVQLIGYDKEASLQVFVGSDSGKVKPHGFYQACKVCGKNSTSCTETEIDGTSVIEMKFEPSHDMKLSLDNVGILKLRNADVEQRVGITRAKKRSTKARLIFRASFPKPDGSTYILQIASTPILCTQPVGHPEICRQSLTTVPAAGGVDLFLIGKNFLKGTKVLFSESNSAGDVTWEEEGKIEDDYFQQAHIICSVPPYHDEKITEPVSVDLTVVVAGRVSEARQIMYTPVEDSLKKEAPPNETEKMEIDTKPDSDLMLQPEATPIEVTPITVPFSISPVALELNKLIQQNRGTTIFQIPPECLISTASVTPTASIQKPVVVSIQNAETISVPSQITTAGLAACAQVSPVKIEIDDDEQPQAKMVRVEEPDIATSIPSSVVISSEMVGSNPENDERPLTQKAPTLTSLLTLTQDHHNLQALLQGQTQVQPPQSDVWINPNTITLVESNPQLQAPVQQPEMDVWVNPNTLNTLIEPEPQTQPQPQPEVWVNPNSMKTSEPDSSEVATQVQTHNSEVWVNPTTIESLPGHVSESANALPAISVQDVDAIFKNVS